MAARFRWNIIIYPDECLVGGLEYDFYFFHILGQIIPTDPYFFQRGGSTTKPGMGRNWRRRVYQKKREFDLLLHRPESYRGIATLYQQHRGFQENHLKWKHWWVFCQSLRFEEKFRNRHLDTSLLCLVGGLEPWNFMWTPGLSNMLGRCKNPNWLHHFPEGSTGSTTNQNS